MHANKYIFLPSRVYSSVCNRRKRKRLVVTQWKFFVVFREEFRSCWGCLNIQFKAFISSLLNLFVLFTFTSLLLIICSSLPSPLHNTAPSCGLHSLRGDIRISLWHFSLKFMNILFLLILLSLFYFKYQQKSPEEASTHR